MKPIVELIRLEERYRYGTFGILRLNKEVFCVTLEPPDIENERYISSIPAQQYMCCRINSPDHGETFEVAHVPNRSGILFHPGNRLRDTQGCIILGQYWSKLYGDRAVLNSGNTFKVFMAVLKGINKFHLTIKEVY